MFQLKKELTMAEVEEDSTNPDNINQQYIFIHFQTPEQCNFHIVNNKHLQVAYKCCDGKGVAYPRKNSVDITISTRLKETFISIQGTCDICFEEGVSLFNTCNTCSHPFCKPCLKKITNKECPYCRGKLNNKFE